MSAETPWPCPIPPELGPERSPGGLVALVWCPVEGELSRVTLGAGVTGPSAGAAGDDAWAIAEARMLEDRPAPWIVMYDGDTGHQVAALRHDFVPAVLGLVLA